MHYRLHENLALRGWDGQPYALRDISSGQTAFIGEDAFYALSFCNGVMDCDGFLIPERHKRIIKFFAKQEMVKPCHEGESNAPGQAYQKYPCKFIAVAHWSITGKCNMRCRHCYMSAPQAKFGELPHEKCMHIIEQLAQAGIGTVNLTGGEPLIRKDFLDLVRALRGKNIAINQIYTNGMLVNQQLLDELNDLGVHPEFSISFDGVGWHDWLRGIDGAEEMAVKAIQLLAQNGYHVGVESAFHRHSIHTIEETMHLLAELGVRHWKVNPVSNAGNWCFENRSLDLSLEDLYNTYLKTIKAYFAAGSPITMMLGGFFQCMQGEKEYLIPCKKNGNEQEPLCLSARNMMYISADATLLPCLPMAALPVPGDMPNLNEMPLLDALSDSLYLKRIQTPVSALIARNEECRVCEYRAVCGGGCRACALMENEGNDYLGVDPAICFFFKNRYEEKIARIVSTAG